MLIFLTERLMITSYTIHRVLEIISIPVDIRNICVFLAPVFASFTAISSYFFAKEITKRSEAGLLAGLFISIVPSKFAILTLRLYVEKCGWQLR